MYSSILHICMFAILRRVVRKLVREASGRDMYVIAICSPTLFRRQRRSKGYRHKPEDGDEKIMNILRSFPLIHPILPASI